METQEREIAEQKLATHLESETTEQQTEKAKKTNGIKVKNINKIQLCMIAAALAIIVLMAAILLPPLLNPDAGKVFTVSFSSLQRVLETSNLTTLSFTYNAITPVYDAEKSEEIKYHVAYKGQVKAGLDITKITMETLKEEKIIRIVLPEIVIQEVSVNMGTLDFIFHKGKYETDTVSQEAYKASLRDLQERANAEKSLMNIAKENAVKSIKALIAPWEQAYEEYTIVVE